MYFRYIIINTTTMKKFVLSLLVAVTASISFSQKFEGIITMTMEYDDLPPEMEMYESMLPKENIIKIKNEKSRVESGTMGQTMVVITDTKKKSGVMLMNMMGQKIAINLDAKDFEAKKEEETKSTTKITKETKTISGYKCTKAIITDEDGSEMEIWYTKEIPAIKSQNDKLPGKIDGFPMLYTMTNTQMGEMTITITVSKVDTKAKISDSEFETPEGYEEMTQEELQQMMGGAMGGQ